MVTNETIIIDDGSKEYVFKNHLGVEFAKFAFNPTDTGLIERYEGIVKYFESLTLDKELSEEETAEKIKEMDAGIKKQFDVFCNSDVSEGIFGRYTPMTLFANGDFYCEVALEQIANFISKELDTRLDKKKAKIRKAIAKNRK